MEVACWTVIAAGSAASKAHQSTWAENGLPRWSGQVVVSFTSFDTMTHLSGLKFKVLVQFNSFTSLGTLQFAWVLLYVPSCQAIGSLDSEHLGLDGEKLVQRNSSKAISIPSIHAEWLQPLDLGKS